VNRARSVTEWADAPFDGEELAPVAPSCVIVPRNRRKTDALATVLRQRAHALRTEAARLERAANEREGIA
jgi:hypothetical protein